jgi:hypothetical protein
LHFSLVTWKISINFHLSSFVFHHRGFTLHSFPKSNYLISQHQLRLPDTVTHSTAAYHRLFPPLNAIASRKSAELDFLGAPVNLEGPTLGDHHGNSPSIEPLNSQLSMQPSQPSGVTIVNGAPAQGDHSRKPSVTISSAGTTGYIPNGGPAGSARIQFGDLPQSPSSQSIGSPAPPATQPQPNNLGVSPTPSNPRVPSPQDPPSPIPQHSSSGGRPPSSFQYQGSNMNMSFGSMNSGDDVSGESPLPPPFVSSRVRSYDLHDIVATNWWKLSQY